MPEAIVTAPRVVTSTPVYLNGWVSDTAQALSQLIKKKPLISERHLNYFFDQNFHHAPSGPFGLRNLLFG